MTDAPNNGTEAEPEDGSRAGDTPPAPASYPPPYTPHAHVGDDELASALAAQTAMYTGPITIPVVNSDPSFRPDPAELDDAVPPPALFAPSNDASRVSLPPVPVPPAPAPTAYVAPDLVAGDPDAGVFAEPAASVPPVADAPVYEIPVVDTNPFAPPVFDESAFEAQPTADAPAVDDAPVFEIPEVDSPVFAVPAFEPPVSESPVFDAPVFDAPVFDVPAADFARSDADIFGEPQQATDAPVFPAPGDPYGPPPQSFQLDTSQLPPEFAPPAPEASAPLPDEGGSTLDAILKLEDELRRRQVLPPDFVPDAEASPPPLAEESLDERLRAAMPPAPADASFAPPPQPTPVPVAGPGPVAADVPGWIPAPDPQHEGQSPAADPTAPPEPWLSAPPPAFAPPPLVEPPVVGGEGFDPARLTPTPLTAPAPPSTSGIDVTTLPPPGATPPQPVSIPAGFAPSDFFGATPAQAFVAETALDPDAEGIDDIDRADLVNAIPVSGEGVAQMAPVPLGVAPLETDATDIEPRDPHPFVVERAATLPTPLEQRAGRAARMFWLWFAANSSFVAVAVGATMLAMGLSLRQALVATLLGVVLSTVPLGLGTRAGKWSGQPTMVVSRASFGHFGNIIPALLSILSRVFWGGVLLWLLAITITPLVSGDSTTGLTIPALVALGIGVVLASLVAVLGFGLLYRVQRILGILSLLLIVATIALTVDEFDASVILRSDEGSWVLAVGGAVLVFSVIGLAWAHSSSDLARYQRPGSSTGATSVWSIIGVIAPTLVIVSWGAILAASNPQIAESLSRDPLATLMGLVPLWFALPLLAVAGFGLISGGIITMYSGGLAIISAGIRMPRAIATLVAAILVGVVGFVLLALDADARDIVRDLATTLAVPVAAWAGIFGGEMMLRSRRFHAPSLLARGGVYPAFRWVNLIGLLVITGVGFGLTSAAVQGLTWQGYLFAPLGISADNPWATVDGGVIVALFLGLLLPIVAGIPAIRRQEKRPESTATSGMPVVDALVD